LDAIVLLENTPLVEFIRNHTLDFSYPRKSSEMFGNIRETFEQVLENPRKYSESGRKSSENRPKRRYQCVYIQLFRERLSDKTVRDNAECHYG